VFEEAYSLLFANVDTNELSKKSAVVFKKDWHAPQKEQDDDEAV